MASEPGQGRLEENPFLGLIPPGTVVSHYKIFDKIGAGGMGVVYRAEDLKLKRPVALKFLPPNLTQDSKAKERFAREAQAASSLDHPNICTVHEIDESKDGQMFIAMAYYEGDTLRQIVKRGPLEVGRALDIAGQIAAGLKEAHDLGIVHRDVKSANVIITPKGQAKIMDFGLAKLAGDADITLVGTTVGTVAYMSPEQAAGREVDARADIWSLGVILYEMVSGKLPFPGDHGLTVINSILNSDPIPVESLRQDLPGEVREILAKALAKPIEARYQTAGEMLTDLKRAAGLPGTSGPEAMQPIGKRLPSIAVLPFTNLSGDPEQEYFCDGMAEEIINALTHVEQLRVVARTSAFAFKGKSGDIREIGGKLGVSSVLEGSVRKAGDRVRITAQLINVADGYHMWSERFDRRMEDVFAIQDEISLAIVESLKVKLIAPEKRKVTRRHTESLEAYNLYLKGRYSWNKRTADGLRNAVTCFEEAIRKDPNYALAHSGLADALTILGFYQVLPQEEAQQRAQQAVLKAIELDDGLGEAHASLGEILSTSGGDPQRAGAEFERAIALNPGYATAHHWYSILLWDSGRFEEAFAEGKRALELDPLSVIIKIHVSQLRAASWDWAGAERLLGEAVETDPENAKLRTDYAVLIAVAGRKEESLAQARRAMELAPDDTWARGIYGWVLCLGGEYDAAVEVLGKLVQVIPHSSFAHVVLGISYAGQGQHDKARGEFDVALELSKTDKSTRQWASAFRGASLGMMGRAAEARAELGHFLEEAKQERVSPYWFAVLYFGLGDLDRGFEFLDRARDEHDTWLVNSGVGMLFDKIGPDPRCESFRKKMGL